MNLYRNTGNIKAGLFIIGIGLVIGLITYTQILINELRKDNREIVNLYAEIIANTVKDDNDTNLDFVFDNIIKKVKFPLIQTDNNYQIRAWKNLPSNILTKKDRQKMMVAMDKLNQPIPLKYKDEYMGEITFGYLHYGDSSIVQKLQIWTYIEIFSIGIFIFLGFLGFSFIRNNEKRHIWVGMARETAHQLGTPVSALMGWVDWLKKHPEKTNDLIPEMEADLQRLKQIGRRFSKMGSKTEMEVFDLSEKIELILGYLKIRLPSLGKTVDLINDIEPGIMIKANGSLLAWSIENIIRNAIDAIEKDNGEVRVTLRKNIDAINIQIQDNGKGIPKKDWRNIFRPGFSTKQTGWGLGLSLSNRIVEDIHKGKIRVVESILESGTVVEITL